MINSISKNLHKVDDSFVIDLVITMIVIAIFYIVLFPNPRVDNLSYDLSEDIQRALINPKLIEQQNYEALFNRYRIAALYNNTFKKFFTSHGAPKISLISAFGIALLAKFAEDDTQEDYRLVAEHLITSLDSILQQPNYKDLVSTWKLQWRKVIPLTLMFAMYLYLGEQSSVLTICYQRIIQISPKLDQLLDRNLVGVDLARAAIPRLMANYLSARRTYRSEVKSDVFKSLNSVFNLTKTNATDVKDNVYLDGSAICNKVATFEHLVALVIHAKVYVILGQRSNIEDLVTSTLDDVLHPDLDFLPLGVFGDVSGKDILAAVPDYRRTAALGVKIFPIIGLGVFKAPAFVFSLRVQRPGIAAYRSDDEDYQSALGWIQMRKMFVKRRDYGDIWTWESLMDQPGIMRMEDTDAKLEALKAKEDFNVFLADQVESHLGHLDDLRLMFWVNKYSFKPLFGDLLVTEFGLCTDNGLALRYVIKNVTKSLKIQMRDKDLDGPELKFLVDEGVTLTDNSYLMIGEDKDFQWRQVFDEDLEPKDIKVQGLGMTFKFNNDTWNVEVINKDQFIVRRGKKIVLAGSSSGNIDDKFEYNGRIYRRNPLGLMYKEVKTF